MRVGLFVVSVYHLFIALILVCDVKTYDCGEELTTGLVATGSAMALYFAVVAILSVVTPGVIGDSLVDKLLSIGIALCVVGSIMMTLGHKFIPFERCYIAPHLLLLTYGVVAIALLLFLLVAALVLLYRDYGLLQEQSDHHLV